MIPFRQSVYRNLSRAVQARAQGIVFARFQSASTTNPIPEIQPVKPEVQPVKPDQVVNKPTKSSEKTSDIKPKGKRKYQAVNPKLRDIADQIRESVKASSNDLTEAVTILNEGLSYLREIQVSENIDDKQLFSWFQPIVTQLFFKALDPKMSLGKYLIEEILDSMVEFRVAHKYHFTALAVNYYSSDHDKQTIYRNVLKLWVQSVEYEKSLSSPLPFPYVLKEVLPYRPFYLPNLAYFAFVQSCLQEGIKYTTSDAVKLLQSEKLPPPYLVIRTLDDVQVGEKFKDESQKFGKAIRIFEYENLDPNGQIVYKKINNASERKDVYALNSIYNDINDASKKEGKSINEDTLVRLMKGYLEAGKCDDVFKIFQTILQNGIEKPSISTWEMVLRAMGHPNYIRRQAKKDLIVENIERTVETIVSNGTQVTAKTLSIIISCFANLNRFDKVDEYLQKFDKLPVISPTKNNILIGLLLNKKITEAESKLKEFMSDGSGYVPFTSTMNTFLDHYSKTKNYKAVEGILEFMKKYNIPEEVATYTIVIDIFFKLHREKGLEPNVNQILSSITTSKNIQLNDFTFTTLVDGLARDGLNIEAAREIFETATKKYKYSAQLHTSMLKGELDFGLVGNAEKIFDNYIKKISNDTRVWNMMISGLIRKHEDLAFEYFENLKKQTDLKVEPNQFTYYFLLNHVVKRGNNDRTQYIIDNLADKKLNQLGTELPKLLSTLTDKFNFSPELLAELKN